MNGVVVNPKIQFLNETSSSFFVKIWLKACGYFVNWRWAAWFWNSDLHFQNVFMYLSCSLFSKYYFICMEWSRYSKLKTFAWCFSHTMDNLIRTRMSLLCFDNLVVLFRSDLFISFKNPRKFFFYCFICGRDFSRINNLLFKIECWHNSKCFPSGFYFLSANYFCKIASDFY